MATKAGVLTAGAGVSAQGKLCGCTSEFRCHIPFASFSLMSIVAWFIYLPRLISVFSGRCSLINLLEFCRMTSMVDPLYALLSHKRVPTMMERLV